MFGKRADGRRVRQVEPFSRIIPYIMKTRNDAMNLFEEDLDCGALDAYLAVKKEAGQRLNYMHVLVASLVRLFALKPQLNRFVMRGRIFARKDICVSFVVHTSLRSDEAGTTIKLHFDGTEDIFAVAKKIDEAVERETNQAKESNSTDKLAAAIMKIPGPFISLAVNTLMWMDRHDMLPASIIEASPFHTSFFVTNLKSLGIGPVYHHVYNFGTTGFFVGMGKETHRPVIKQGEIVEAKILNLKVVTDERYCDGLYFARACRLWRKLLSDPAVLETPLEAREEDCP